MVIPPGFAEVTFRWRIASGYRESMTSCGFSIAAWDEDIDEVRFAWQAFFGALGSPSTSETTGVDVKVGTSDPSAPITFSSDVTAAGSGSGALISPNVCLLATKNTGRGGRKGRGRMFLPPPLEGQIDNSGHLDETFQGNVQESLTDLITNVGLLLDSEGGPFLLHSSELDEPDAITSTVLSGIVATQRDRLTR